MSTKEMAYSIFEQLTEEELQGFVALFRRVHPPKTDEDDIAERRAIFEELEKMRRPIPDLDEKKELAEYREEKYGR